MRGNETAAPAQVPTGARRPGVRPQRRRGQGPAQRVPELAGLDLPQLRAYRRELGDEETRVSYWRRLVQARLDVLTALPPAARPAPAAPRLRQTLAEQTRAPRRQVMLSVHHADDAPPLPDLEVLWWSLDDGDEAVRTEVVARLTDAEAQLSAYRAALHRRLDRATGELIARYQRDPASCLSALPLQRP